MTRVILLGFFFHVGVFFCHAVAAASIVAVFAQRLYLCDSSSGCSPDGFVACFSSLPFPPKHPRPPLNVAFAIAAPSARPWMHALRAATMTPFPPFCRYVDLKFSAPTQGLLQVNQAKHPEHMVGGCMYFFCLPFWWWWWWVVAMFVAIG